MGSLTCRALRRTPCWLNSRKPSKSEVMPPVIPNSQAQPRSISDINKKQRGILKDNSTATTLRRLSSTFSRSFSRGTNQLSQTLTRQQHGVSRKSWTVRMQVVLLRAPVSQARSSRENPQPPFLTLNYHREIERMLLLIML